jgi:hypothetical protein
MNNTGTKYNPTQYPQESHHRAAGGKKKKEKIEKEREGRKTKGQESEREEHLLQA